MASSINDLSITSDLSSRGASSGFGFYSVESVTSVPDSLVGGEKEPVSLDTDSLPVSISGLSDFADFFVMFNFLSCLIFLFIYCMAPMFVSLDLFIK
jgi:hypothetical protein